MSDGLKKIVRIVFIVIGVVLIGKFSLDWFNASREYAEGMSSAEQRISEYQTQIMSNQKILDGAKDDMQTLSGNLHDMSSLGKNIADWQTDFANYSNFYGASQTAAREGTGVNDRIHEVQELLLSKFDEDDVYVWYDWNSKVQCIWKCVTSYSYYGDSMKVMWICQPYGADLYKSTDDITVYAYAVADYDYVDDHFSNLETGITEEGAKYLYTYEQDQEVQEVERDQIAIDRNNGVLSEDDETVDDGQSDQDIVDEPDVPDGGSESGDDASGTGTEPDPDDGDGDVGDDFVFDE